jgi:hypothetical protein
MNRTAKAVVAGLLAATLSLMLIYAIIRAFGRTAGIWSEPFDYIPFLVIYVILFLTHAAVAWGLQPRRASDSVESR